MEENEQLTKKLQTSLKLSGFSVRKPFCGLIISKFLEQGVDPNSPCNFEKLCNNLEKQGLCNSSIELGNIEEVIEACLRTGRDKTETVFNVINAFDFPKLQYNVDRKTYGISTEKRSLLAGAASKPQLFLERYRNVLQRTSRNFKSLQLEDESDRPSLQTVEYLLTSNKIKLHRTLVLGALIQVACNKFYLEDPTGMVQLDLTNAKYSGRFFLENTFVLVNGYYEDKVLLVSNVILPPGEKYVDSRQVFNNINYFGGPSPISLRESKNLADQMAKNPAACMFFFSDVWLDNDQIFEKLEVLFDGLNGSPPIAFVFMGNFLGEQNGSEKVGVLKRRFKEFAELAGRYSNLVNNSSFVFVPGTNDLSMQHIVPRLPIPNHISEDVKRFIPNAIFTTNPCRLQYCNREIVIFRTDLLAKLNQGTVIHSSKIDEPNEDTSECLARYIIGQGHLCPMPLNAMPVHWDFDYALQLYPLPDLVVLGDKSESFKTVYKECHVVNPGSFCDSGFLFMSYVPANNFLAECSL